MANLLDSTETMELVTAQKIEEAVKGILREADMDQMTEFKLRIAASAKLGFDLSETNYRKLVRDVLEAFLLSNPGDEAANGEKSVPEMVAPAEKEKEKGSGAAATSAGGEDERIICKLSEKRNAKVEKYRGQAFLTIGETSQENGKPFRGVHLSGNQWYVIKKNFAAIEEGIKQCQSKLRSESKQNGDTSKAVDNNTTCGFSMIETSRFDGKSYLCWSSQMELFLKQLNLSYVLSQPCPLTNSSEINPREISRADADAAGKNWLRDDYLCHNHLLNSLSDHLYRQYSKKFKHAKELWDDLKWVYQFEESNSKRSQVRKYIEFKMVEERPILEQVQDVNKIADSIVSAGMFLDETFHVSTIISKFPPSWSGFSTGLMEEEFLPVWMLMERVKAEELLRNKAQRVTYRPATGSSQMERLHSLGGRGSQSIGWKRKEPERVVIVCDNCGRRGHLAKNCWGKTSDERASWKPNRVTTSSATAPVVSETQATTNNQQ
uniref:RNA polymerase II transcriptional coactivator KELP n=1 Tax=Noccaea caerulescens TaxID=107243 RepID=A0A1J3HXY5_NOCCA